MADACLGQQIGGARKDASATKRDAGYSVAAEKGDALAGAAKSDCAAAKSWFG
jgi:hypothetical protein